VAYGTTAQYCALAPCSSDLRHFLWGDVAGPLPSPKPGGPGLCIYDPCRQVSPDIPLGSR